MGGSGLDLRGTNQEFGRPYNRRIVLETIRLAAPIAVRTVIGFLREGRHALDEVRFVLYVNEDVLLMHVLHLHP